MIGNPSQSHRIPAQACRRHPFLRRLECLFWLVVGLAAGWFILASLGVVSYQVTQAKRLDVLQQSHTPSRILRPGDPFGKISIPRIGLSAMIAEGDDESTLRHAVGHIPGTATPWSTGNVALAGRRDTLFRGLSRVRLDDVISLDTPQGAYRYRIVRITVVGPQHTELFPSAESDLTLITCLPFDYIGRAPQRYIVQASHLPTRPSP